MITGAARAADTYGKGAENTVENMNYTEQFDLWLANVEPEQKRELLGLSEEERRESFYTELEFGTAGMRGILRLGSNGMNEYTVGRATAGLADYVVSCGRQSDGVVISYDSRHRSREFARLTACILAANGVRSYLYDRLRPVPLLSFGVRHFKAYAGVMITASHNPKEYNGYKVYGSDGAQLSLEPAAAMLERIRAKSYFGIEAADFDAAVEAGLINVVGEELDRAYFDAVLPLFDLSLVASCPELKIVYTPLHGSGCRPVCRAFELMGLKGVHLLAAQAEPDGDFSTVKSPNPENIEALSMAVEYAREVGADLVIGTDPVCDRMGAAVRNKDGEYVPLTGNQLGCIMLEGLLSSRKAAGTLPGNGAVIKTIVTTELVRDIAAHYGAETVEVLTGFKFIGEKIKEYETTGEHTYLFGFEESYGYLLGTHARDKDGVVACMLLAQTACSLAAQGKTLLDGLQDIYARYGFWREKTVSFTLSGMEGMAKIKSVMQRLAQESISSLGGRTVIAVRDYNKRQRVQDGKVSAIELPASNVLYYELEDGWACVRPSGTEPKLKVYFAVREDSREDADRALNLLESDICAAVGLK